MGDVTASWRSQIIIEPCTPFVSLVSGRALSPARFKIIVGEHLEESDEPIVEVDVAVEDGRMACVGVQFRRRPGGRPITSTDLGGLALKRLIKQVALPLAALRFNPDGSLDLSQPDVSQPGAFELIRAAQVEREELHKEIQQAIDRSEHSRGRKPVTTERLVDVARIYRDADSQGKNPTAAVKEQLGCVRSTAGRWVMLARKAGHLGKAPGPRRAGERR